MPATTPRGYEYPLYSDAQNVPGQLQALAEDIDADVQGLYTSSAAARNAPTASASFAGLVDIPTGVMTQVVFNSELYDNASMIDLGSAPGDISIPQVGLYVVTAWVEFNQALGATTTASALFVRSVGGLVPDVVTVTKELGSPATRLSVVTLTRCTSTAENITLWVQHNFGSPISIQFANLTVTKVAP